MSLCKYIKKIKAVIIKGTFIVVSFCKSHKLKIIAVITNDMCTVTIIRCYFRIIHVDDRLPKHRGVCNFSIKVISPTFKTNVFFVYLGDYQGNIVNPAPRSPTERL